MAIGFEQREELKKGIYARDRYKELNKNTIEILDSYDPILKTRKFKKTTIDENAKKFHIKPKPTPKPKPRNLKIVKSTKKEISKTIKPRKSREVKNPIDYSESKRHQLYDDFINGLTKEQLMLKYNLTKNRVSCEIYSRRRMLGLITSTRNVSYNKCVELIKQGLTNTQIGKQINLSRNTVSYHRSRYEKQLTQ